VDFFTELYARGQHTEHDNELARAELGSHVIAARHDRRRHVFAEARHTITSLLGHLVRGRRRQTTPRLGTPAATPGAAP
jgi:hypothetical protein